MSALARINMTVRRYSRVSRQEQARDTEALNRQNWKLDRAAERLGYSLADVVPYEDVQSGREDDRAQFQQMLTDLRNEDIVLILRTDRIARDTEVNARLAKTFAERKIQLYIDLKGRFINWADPSEWREFIDQGTTAEYESRELSRRITDGFEYLQEKGFVLARVPWGYRRTKERRYERIPELVPLMRWTIETMLTEKSLQTTARLFNQRQESKRWTPNGLRRWFANPVLRGHSPYRRSRSGDSYEKIVWYTHAPNPEMPDDTTPDESILRSDEHDAINAILSDNRGYWGRNQRRDLWTPLGGLLYCGTCGTKMTPVTGSTKESPQRYYVCRQRLHTYVHERCEMKYAIRVETAEKIVIAALAEQAEEIAKAAAEPIEASEPSVLLELRHQLEQLERLGDNPAILRACGELRQQIAQMRIDIRTNGVVYAEQQQLIIALSEPDYYHSLTNEERRAVFQAVLLRVVAIGQAEPTGELSRRGRPKLEVSWSFQVELKR